MEEIRISHILQVLRKNKKRFLINAAIVFVLACAYILCIPRYYRSEVLLAPETESSNTLNSLSSIASTFGFNLDAGQGTDAISPDLYPDLFKSNDFVVGLLSIQLSLDEPEIQTDYFDYLAHYQKQTPWAPAIHAVKQFLKPKNKERKRPGGDSSAPDTGLDPFMLSESENAIVEAVKSNITCAVDKKTGVISITVKDQDPVICATMADSVKTRLQNFITEYRTSKVRVDLEYNKKICAEAKVRYEKARQRYAEFVDANQDLILQTVRQRQTDLENDLQLQYKF